MKNLSTFLFLLISSSVLQYLLNFFSFLRILWSFPWKHTDLALAVRAEFGENVIQELDNYAQTALLKLKAQKALIDFALHSNSTQRWLIMFVLHFTWQPLITSSSDLNTPIPAVLTQIFRDDELRYDRKIFNCLLRFKARSIG